MWSLNLLGKKVTIVKYLNFIFWYFIDMPDSIPRLNTKKLISLALPLGECSYLTISVDNIIMVYFIFFLW